MKLAVFTVTMPDYTPEQALEVLASMGYEGVEWRVTDQSPTDKPSFWAGNLCTWPLSTFVEDAPRIKRMTEAAGLGMPNVGTYMTCEDLSLVDRAMQGVAALGCPQLRVNVPRFDGSESYTALRDRARSQYREVEALAKRHGVRALVEMHMGTITPSASSAAAFLEGMDPQHVGVVHDAGNMVFEGQENYRMGLETLGPYLAHVHLKNGVWKIGTGDDGGKRWQMSWVSIDQGVADIPLLLRTLKDVGYDGWISFEDFSTSKPLEERLRFNLEYVKELLADL